MENEIWKPIIIDGIDYTGLYEISNLGRVKSLNYKNTGEERILKCGKRKGYLLVHLSKDRKVKTIDVHKLVALHFVDGWFEGAVVDHIDTNKEKNIWTNLRWVTPKENSNNELTLQHVSEVMKDKNAKAVYCFELDKEFNSIKKALEYLGKKTNNTTKISNACKDIAKTAYKYHWYYIKNILYKS